MSKNKLPSTLPAIESMILRLKAAETSKQKVINFTIDEVRAIASEVAIMSSRLNSVVAEIHSSLQKAAQPTDIKVSGGGFKD
jgi:predicted transcriptional regulator